MGDAPGITLLSLVPLLIIAVLMVAVFVAWLSGRRSVRVGVGLLLLVLGVATFLPGLGLLFSFGSDVLMISVGLVMLIAAYSRGRPD